MKIINNSKNTIYLEDIDTHIPYRNGDAESVTPDLLKKSRSLRGFIIGGMFDVAEYDENERIEASIVYLKNKVVQQEEKRRAKIPEKNEKEEFIELPSLPRITDEIEVKIHGIFYDAGGYGKVNRNLATKLNSMGFKIKVEPKRGQNQLQEEELEPIVKLTKNKISRHHILIDSLIPSFADFSSGKYKILYTTIESYSVPDQFVECCQHYNEIWVTSEWSSTVLRKYIDQPIYTVVTGVDPSHYTETGPRFDFRPNVKGFVFVSVFGWNYRKGYDVLLKAYFDEFSSDDNVSLLIMSRYQSGQSKFHRNKIKNDIDLIMDDFPNKDLPHVVRYSRVVPEKDMPKIYRAANCFVLPTRGEGGGLPPLEASMCGLPVIMTNCSGQQGYLREDNSYMLEIDSLQTVQRGQMHLHYWDGQQFPALTSQGVHNSLRKYMRSVVDNYKEAKRKNKKLQKMILENFTWNHTAKSASERLREIHNQTRS